MDIFKHINNNLLNRYAKWIAIEDMKKCGIPIINVNNVKSITIKEKAHG
tara:strand:- start:520 stop:666 length:147 start_codon:yes stop_codon:yes gene_type:complete